MRSPDLVEPDRLEELLAGAAPEREREADLQRLIRELRTGAPPAPAAVRSRVRELEARPRRRFAPKLRPAAIAAVTAVLVAVVAGSVLVVRDSAPPQPASAPPAAEDEARGVPGAGEADAAVGEEARNVPLVSGEAVPNVEYSAQGEEPSPTSSPLPDTSRARDVDMSLELRVGDGDEVSDAANEAMRTARALGGYVVSSNVETEGDEGRARLALRVPVGRLEDAVVRLSALGTITEQEVAIEDLQGAIDRRGRRIEALQRAIRIDELRLRSGTLTAEERLEVEIRLERTRDLLADLVRVRNGLLREAATAELTLTVHTREAPPGRPDESRIGGAARDALDFLAGAGSVAVFAAIVGAPLAALAFAAWLLARSRARRLERRILDRPQPAAAPTHAPPS